MAWEKSAPSFVALFGACLPDDPRIERRRMFGYPAAFVQGNMYAGLFEDQMFVRLSPQDRATLETEYGPHPFSPMPGRAMGAYTRLPEDILADESEIEVWLRRGLAHTAGLPPKIKAAKKRKSGDA